MRNFIFLTSFHTNADFDKHQDLLISTKNISYVEDGEPVRIYFGDDALTIDVKEDFSAVCSLLVDINGDGPG